ncbi:uncharacterized protein [Gossypium hirsutum]|uniref:Reverse transcriptase domain-containing protein n=1 Tax=Gossypium hirsutum TaxID=3635 RepID=A0A1U8N151_GOSHI|nr:uncharacterized protein LOC107943568 [Gossypium hirsutum]
MVTLFHDMMHKEIEVYVDDMIAKSRIEKEHIQVLGKLFLRLKKFQLKLNPAKCSFGAKFGKLLGFVVSEKGIEIDPDKVKAIQELSPPRTQKEGEWETRDPKLIDYWKLVLELVKEYDDITFCYLPRDENQMADALATLASMIKVNKQDVKPIQMSIYETPAHCYSIKEDKEKDDHPWYHNILQYVKNHEYLDQAEAKRVLEEVHEGICGTYANGFTMARSRFIYQRDKVGSEQISKKRDHMSIRNAGED